MQGTPHPGKNRGAVTVSVMIYVLLAVLLIVVGLVARKLAAANHEDSLGSMSAQWLAEHRQGRS